MLSPGILQSRATVCVTGRRTARAPEERDRATRRRRPEIDLKVCSGDFLANEKISWRNAYAAQMPAAVRPLQQAAE